VDHSVGRRVNWLLSPRLWHGDEGPTPHTRPGSAGPARRNAGAATSRRPSRIAW